MPVGLDFLWFWCRNFCTINFEAQQFFPYYGLMFTGEKGLRKEVTEVSPVDPDPLPHFMFVVWCNPVNWRLYGSCANQSAESRGHVCDCGLFERTQTKEDNGENCMVISKRKLKSWCKITLSWLLQAPCDGAERLSLVAWPNIPKYILQGKCNFFHAVSPHVQF